MAGRRRGAQIRGMCLGLLLVGNGGAMAADAAPGAIGLLAPVRYADQAAAKAAVRDNCELEKTLQDDLLTALRARGQRVEPVASTNAGDVLEVVIQRVEAAGSRWTGPKMLSVTARLYKDGKPAHLRMLAAWGHGGANLFAGTCQVLHSDSADLAAQAAHWLDELDQAAARSEAAAAASSVVR